MARSSRGRGRKSSTRQRRQVDWVVNELTYDSLANPYSIPNNGIVFAALTIPKWAVSYTDPTFSVQYPGYWLPEQDSGQVAYAVRGTIEQIPETWVAGSFYRMGYRIMKAPVEYAAGFNSLTDPAYSIFTAAYANERFLWQRIMTGYFAQGSQPEHVSVDWKGVCKIEANEALFMVLENQTGVTQRVIVRPWLRTLMRADA